MKRSMKSRQVIPGPFTLTEPLDISRLAIWLQVAYHNTFRSPREGLRHQLSQFCVFWGETQLENPWKYPPVSSNIAMGKSLMNGGVDRKITYKWSIFRCHV